MTIDGHYKRWILLFSLSALWGASFPLTSIVVRELPPDLVVMMRMSMAAWVLLAWMYARGQRLATSMRHWLFYALMALIGNVMPYTLIGWGQRSVDSGVAGVLMALMPLITLFLAHCLLDDERLTWRALCGFVLGFLGVAVLMWPHEFSEGGGTLIARLAILSGAVCYAMNALLARFRPAESSLSVAAGVALMAALQMLPLVAGRFDMLAVVSPVALWALVALGVLATAVGAVLYFALIETAGATFMSLINYLIPLWALLLGALWLGEQPGIEALVALGLILTGVALSQSKRGHTSN